MNRDRSRAVQILYRITVACGVILAIPALSDVAGAQIVKSSSSAATRLSKYSTVEASSTAATNIATQPQPAATETPNPTYAESEAPQTSGAASLESAEVETLFLTESIVSDIESNPGYSDSTKAILIEQIENDYDVFDVIAPQSPVSSGRLTLSQVDKTSPYSVNPLILDQISLFDSMTGSFVSHDCPTSGPCEFPEEYNIPHDRVWVSWRYRDAEARETFDRFIRETGTSRLQLRVNQTLRTRGASAADLSAGYYVLPDGPCSQAGECLVTVFRKNGFFTTPPPWSDWQIEIEGWDEVAVDGHKLAFDRFGNPTVVRTEFRKIVSGGGTIQPKPTLKDYFTATIGQTTLSERCTTCHSMSDANKIAEQHGFGSIEVVQIPSALIPGATINGCNNCHSAAMSQGDFHERRWATPPAAMDINWAQIVNDHPNTWAREICERMVANMPSADIREEHFHEDARLFWAVASGELPGGGSAPTAVPHNYDDFIDRFDRWNAAGARCPQN